MKSFLSGRPTAPISSLKPIVDVPVARAFGGSAATTSTKTMAEHEHLPAVECVRQGDKVTHLIVTCSCGERIEIDCLYAGPS